MKIIRLIPLFVLTFLTLTSCGGGGCGRKR